MNNLSSQILSTLIYYDILDYPMTSFEVWKYLNATDRKEKEEDIFKLHDIMKELENDKLKNQIEEYRGFYFLRGRKALVERRLEKNKISEQKFKVIRKVVFWLRFLPFVRMVAVTGTVAMKNAGQSSDLDLLIVLKSGRIFLGRTLVTGLVHLMGKRRYGKKIVDRICLNCFLTDKSLESRLRDVFSASEYFFIVPLVGRETFRSFQRENIWIKNFKTNFYPDASGNLKEISEKGWAFKIKFFLEKFFELNIFNELEKSLKKWQTERIARDPRTKEEGSIIVADAQALIFFHRAHSLKMNKLFQKRLEELAVS